MCLYDCYGSGAILAMGRGGRETTLWHVIKEVFLKKISDFMSSNQSNVMN